MGRIAKFGREDMARAALELAAERGPQAVTVAAIAAAIGAPTGSIYHRFDSREELLAEIWMDVVESFQRGFIERLATASDIDGAAAAACFMAEWVPHGGGELCPQNLPWGAPAAFDQFVRSVLFSACR